MVALGYHGDSFHGSQTQPGIRTVEGSLVRALESLGWWTPNCLEMSSRTDAGVSVRMNLARINLPSEVAGPIQKSNLLRALNDNLPVGMVAWGAKAIPEEMRIRHSTSRHYLYRTELSQDWPRELDEGAFIEACSCLQGQHDFTNLCRIDEGKNPVRTVDECIPWMTEEGRIIGISVKSRAFLWNQVRRMASAISGVASGRNSIEDIHSALERPDIPVDLGRSPSEGLMLWSIENLHTSDLIDSSLPDTSWFTAPTVDDRQHTRWLSLARLEMSTLLEREWMRLLRQA